MFPLFVTHTNLILLHKGVKINMEDNVKCKKSDIKIFVSHRIDLDSVTIENSLYYPVRCGAIFDKKKESLIPGDDTGDNISKKRKSFCELTVLYWAWKNSEADYYGLCHYRRYLSFADEEYKSSPFGVINCDFINERSIKKFGLYEEKMRPIIENNDLVIAKALNVSNIDARMKTMRKYCEIYDNNFNLEDLDVLFKVLDEKYPEYSNFAKEYYAQPMSVSYNCFVMKKDIFFHFCEWLFDILFEVEKKIDATNYSEYKLREIGFFSEHLLGIYIDYLKANTTYKINERQIVFFENTEQEKRLEPFFKEKNIPIVVLSSNYYVPYLSVYLESLIEHRGDSNYDLIVLHKEITKENQEILCLLCNKYENIHIRFFNARQILGDIKFFVAASFYSEEAYYRLLAPWILSKYEKAIITDLDIIVQRDIADLYNSVTFSEEYIACAKDVVYQGMLNNGVENNLEYCKKTLKLNNPYHYVNTGVMVANLKKIREDFTLEEILDFSEKNQFRIQEQDILNAFYDERIKFIDLKWNMYLKLNYWIDLFIRYAPADEVELYNKALETPYILHWASQPKPWNEPDLTYAHVWWKYARKSPYYEVILQRMQLCHTNIPQLSFARKVADKFFPKGSRRRECLKWFIPRDSLQWRILKKMYHKIALD